ncbi:MAG: ankyrin repeat domain-containing protein [Verrucomicrobia bacterium]|nr:ankyrin repeat domain-containing protein [Verrucomicrobiota bacterium]
MAAKPISASTPSLLEHCLDKISLKFLTDAVQLSCGCYYNKETAQALHQYQLPCIKHEQVPFYYEYEEHLALLVKAVLQKETSSSGKELTPTNVSTEIPEAAKSLYEKGKALFQKHLFTEAAVAFLGATLHYPSYTEAQNSFASALKFIPGPSAGPQISSSDLPMPGTTAPSTTRPLRTNPEPTPAAAAASLQSPAPAPVYHIDKLNTGTIIHNNKTTYAPRVNYAPVTRVTDARRVVDKSRHIYAPQSTYTPTHYTNTSYHINYAAPGSGGAPAAVASPQNKPAAPELPAYVRNAKTPEGRGKALIKAIDRKERDMVDLLLEHKDGIKLDVQDEKYRTPLQAACEGNLTEVLELLIDNGAKTDGEDAKASLIAAAKVHNSEVVKILARSNTPLFSRGQEVYLNHYSSKCEVFEIFVREGDSGMVLFFIDEMKINLQSPMDYTQGYDSGPTISEITLGEIALNIACEIQNPGLVRLLLDKGAKVSKALWIVTDKRNLPLLQLLCGKKEAFYPSARSQHEYFSLILSNQKSNYLVKSLTYADLALLKACERGDLEFAQLLVKTTDLTKSFQIDAGYQEYVYPRLADIAYQVSSKQSIQDLFSSVGRRRNVS